MLGREREESLTHWKELGCCTRHSEWGEGGGMREWKSSASHLRESEFQGFTRSLGSQFLSLLLTTTRSSYPNIYTPGQMVLRWLESGPRSWKSKFCRSAKLLDLFDFQSTFSWRRWCLGVLFFGALRLYFIPAENSDRPFSPYICREPGKHFIAKSHEQNRSMTRPSTVLPNSLDSKICSHKPVLLRFTFKKMGAFCGLFKGVPPHQKKSCYKISGLSCHHQWPFCVEEVFWEILQFGFVYVSRLHAPQVALLSHSQAHRSSWHPGSGLGFPGRDFSADWEAAGSTGWSLARLGHCLYKKQLPFLVGHLLKSFPSFSLKSNN